MEYFGAKVASIVACSLFRRCRTIPCVNADTETFAISRSVSLLLVLKHLLYVFPVIVSFHVLPSIFLQTLHLNHISPSDVIRLTNVFVDLILPQSHLQHRMPTELSVPIGTSRSLGRFRCHSNRRPASAPFNWIPRSLRHASDYRENCWYNTICRHRRSSGER